jgi:hypothetical protein
LKKIEFKKNKKKYLIAILIVLLTGLIAVLIIGKKEYPKISPYPNGKDFAFTIIADPDDNVLEKDKLIYDLFIKVGLKTTIAVWVNDAIRSTGWPEKEIIKQPGDSCQRPDYLQYMQELQKNGFEIALHTVTSGNDYREETIAGYERFKKYFGTYPNINIMHSTNLENVYWGKNVVENNLLRVIISKLARRSNIPYSGEIENSEYFWGDILNEKSKYVRLWGTSDINTLKMNPSMPYHDLQKPYVKYWFSFSDGENVASFNKLISKENVVRLQQERGTSIVYTHFYNFVNDGQINEKFKRGIIRLAKNKEGWFVPASKILNRLLEMKNVKMEVSRDSIYITNLNQKSVEGITIIVEPKKVIYSPDGLSMDVNEDGEIIINKLKPRETKILVRDTKYLELKKEFPKSLEIINMIIQRSLVYIKHNVLKN